jgi:hypothetical protein
MSNIQNYKNKFYRLLESTIGDVKPLLSEQFETSGTISINFYPNCQIGYKLTYGEVKTFKGYYGQEYKGVVITNAEKYGTGKDEEESKKCMEGTIDEKLPEIVGGHIEEPDDKGYAYIMDKNENDVRMRPFYVGKNLKSYINSTKETQTTVNTTTQNQETQTKTGEFQLSQNAKINTTNDKSFDYALDNGKYYFKGKGTQASKYPNWVEAKGNGLNNIKSKVKF